MLIKRTIFIALLGLSGLPQAQAITMPSGSCGVSGDCLTFGDFNVYSLAYLNTVAGFGKPVSGDPYYVASGPGQISGGVVIGTGSSGSPVNQNFPGMDDAFATPNSANGEVTFSTTTAGDPGTLGVPGLFGTADQTTSWDANISDMRSFLATGGGGFTPFFNLNETGTDGLTGIDLQIWVHMWVDNAAGDKQDFYLWGNPLEFGGNGTNTTSAIGPSTNSPNDLDPQWATVNGTICIDGSTVLHFGSCVGTDPSTARNVDQNLGANSAAFAIYNAELDNIIKTSNLYTGLHIDWRMIHENNGFEQAFLLTDTVPPPPPPPPAPEPFTLALLGLGLLGMSRKLLVR